MNISHCLPIRNGITALAALRKPAVSLADSTDLRVILNLMYTMVETLRLEEESDNEECRRLRNNFASELSQSSLF